MPYVVFWGTSAERALRAEGQQSMLLACVVIVVAGAWLMVRRKPVHAIAATAVAPVVAALTMCLPGTGWPWVAYCILMPVSLAAWIAALR